MRIFIIPLLVLFSATTVIGAEVTTSLDRCVILNDAGDNSVESIMALHFNLPNVLTEKEIVSAEIYFPLTISSPSEGPLYEFRLFPAFSDWTEGGIDFREADGIADSLSVGAYTVQLADSNDFHIDITSFVIDLHEGELTNYGLIARGELLGDDNIQLSENLNQCIKTNATVKIVYK